MIVEKGEVCDEAFATQSVCPRPQSVASILTQSMPSPPNRFSLDNKGLPHLLDPSSVVAYEDGTKETWSGMPEKKEGVDSWGWGCA
ncbi:hypothetical protein L1987_43019 [Smallanthus sonchifolius]|uniref:Uncharacterized protein n=1 Tax=Smallanthus sonchifolius TaxID=185202 RepID=A0ACB9GL82_9ASTR|nr:hypothetical protein L1987_43019 [Smallanthus sonchifolius]